MDSLYIAHQLIKERLIENEFNLMRCAQEIYTRERETRPPFSTCCESKMKVLVSGKGPLERAFK